MFYWLPDSLSPLKLKHSFIDAKGIVITMGDNQFYSGISTLKVLRARGCILPIEVFYLGNNDLSVDRQNQLLALENIKLVDMTPLTKNKLGGWACKPFVILFSSFREVIFIDSDSFFLQPIENVFDEPGYIDNGALFYTDRSIGGGRDKENMQWIRDLIPGHQEDGNLHILESRNFQGQSSHVQESGVVVIDKHKHFGALLAVCQLNSDKERPTTYKRVYGDKETFWVGFEMAGDQKWIFSPFLPGSLGHVADWKDSDDRNGKYVSKLCSSKILHLDSKAKPLWFNGGLVKTKFVDLNKQVFENMTHWNVEPGEWQLHGDNCGCLLSTFPHIELDGEPKSWLDDHLRTMQNVTGNAMPALVLPSHLRKNKILRLGKCGSFRQTFCIANSPFTVSK